MFTQTIISHRGGVGMLQPKHQDGKNLLSALTEETNNRCPIGAIIANMIADTLVSVHDYRR